MSAALEIARVNVVRLLRDRMGLFFIFLLPVILILVLGTMYGGRVAPRLGIVAADNGPLAQKLVDSLRTGDVRLEITNVSTEAALRDGVERGTLEMGMLIPSGYDAQLRAGGTATITLLGQPTEVLTVLRQAVESAVARQAATIMAARLAVAHGVAGFDAGLVAARGIQDTLPGVSVTVSTVGQAIFPADTQAFSPGAQSQLVLFMFLTSMTAATQLILTRRLGVLRRMLSTPTPVLAILVGELFGRFAIAMIQGVFIIVFSAVAFGVNWGDPLAAGLLVVAFALVGTGVAMVIGVFANDPDQAGSLGVFAGMLLGALGGAMVPIELFGDQLRALAHLTPHAWAIDGFRTLIFRDGTTVDVLPQLAVLAAMAALFIAIGSWGLRRALTRD